MNTIDRIRQLMEKRGWTEYRLAKQAGLSQSTIANIFRRNTVPSVATIEMICAGFGISLAQFFRDGDVVELSGEQKELFDTWVTLRDDQKKILFELIKSMKKDK